MESQIGEQSKIKIASITTSNRYSKGSLIIIMSILLMVSVAIASLFYVQIQKLSKQISQNQTQLTPIPSPSTNPISDWKISNSKLFSFSYPPNLFLDEREKDYFVLLTDFENPSSVFVSIDARLAGSYKNYDQAIEITEENLIKVKKEEFENGIKISGELGPGYGQGQQVTTALFKYNEAAIKMETTVTESSELQIFDQILSTFNFVETKDVATPTTD